MMNEYTRRPKATQFSLLVTYSFILVLPVRLIDFEHFY